MSGLPSGWATANLGDVAVDIQGGGTPSKNIAENFTGDIPFMTVKDMKTYRPSDTQDKITETALQSCSSRLIPAGTPIVCTRMGLGKIVVTSFATAINQDLKAVFLEKQIVDTQYFEYWYRSITKEINSMGTGTTVKGITLQMLAGLQLPLPPASEQTRIAQKLDELLAQVDTLKARIDAIPSLLKRFRQSVLAAAVSGRLTEEWRIQNVGWVDEGSPTTAPNHETESWASQDQPNLRAASLELPRDWQLVPFSMVINDLRYGTAQKCDYSGGATGVLRIPNIGDKGIDLNDLKSSDFSDVEVKKLALKKGDILLIRSNGSVDLVGKSAIASRKEEGLLFAGYLIRVRPDITKTLSEYVNFWLKSPAVRQLIELTARSTSGVNNINSEEIKSLIFTMPPLPEQTEIVRRVEQLFAFADQLEAKVASAKSRIDHLTQSILAKAFRGELVPQDPNDEPASVLLERIKTQRASAPKAKRGRKPSA